jgi:hypothetical protein
MTRSGDYGLAHRPLGALFFFSARIFCFKSMYFLDINAGFKADEADDGARCDHWTHHSQQVGMQEIKREPGQPAIKQVRGLISRPAIIIIIFVFPPHHPPTFLAQRRGSVSYS